MGENRLEKFEVKTINRTQIHGAAYNPRKISKEAEKNLRKSLKDFGMLAPITINMKTGNVVAGHQRLASMDAILKKPNYDLTVAMVELSPEEEVRANIILNNQNAQGEFDHEKLAELHLDFPEIDFEKDLLFEKFDLDLMFADFGDETLSAFENEAQEEIKDAVEEMREIDAIKRAKKEHRDKVKEENSEGGTNQL